MHKKHISALLAALFLLLLLPGCGLGSGKNREPVRQLQYSLPLSLAGLYDGGGSRVLACWADYDKEITTVQLVDTDNDAVRSEYTLDGVWTIKDQHFADGRFALCEQSTNTWLFLNSSLQELGKWPAETYEGFFSYDGREYYFLRDRVLFRQPVDGGEAVRVSLSTDLRILDITAFDAASGRMAVRFFLSPYSTECGTAMLDTATGQLSMLQEAAYQPVFTGSGLCLLSFDLNTMGYSALYSREDRFFFADASLFAEDGGNLYAISGTPYMMGSSEGHSTLYRLDETPAACPMSGSGIDAELFSGCCLNDEGLLVFAAYQNNGYTLYAVDPAQLNFTSLAESTPAESPLTVDPSLAQSYWGAVSGLPVAESLQDARQYADTLEQQYGVRILLSSQCREAAALCDRAITLTDTIDAGTELECIRVMLEAMSRSFALYPEGFLAQFRSSVGDGGLCFLLVAGIDSNYGVVGCAYEAVDWNYIAVDVLNTYAPDSLLCHEIWHATENRILYHDFTSFSADEWDALNPEGFTYYGDGAMQDPAQPWTLYNSATEDICFVDSYACVDAREDRARIMEYFMVHDDEAKILIQSPCIRQKLQRMCSAVRSTFDTTGWGTPRWERLL